MTWIAGGMRRPAGSGWVWMRSMSPKAKEKGSRAGRDTVIPSAVMTAVRCDHARASGENEATAPAEATRAAAATPTAGITVTRVSGPAVSYTHLTLPTIYSV